MKRGSTIVSIFGQIEGAVADAMAAEKKVHRIAFEDIPLTAAFDEQGQRASCAIILTLETEREFNQRVKMLRA